MTNLIYPAQSVAQQFSPRAVSLNGVKDQPYDREKSDNQSLISQRNWTTWQFRCTGSPGNAKMSEDRTKDSYSSGKSLRILIVEDHGDTLQALSNLLTHFGHEISVADDTESARKIIRSKEIDVVLADIALPDGSGYDLIAEAKRKRPVKAVALTGFGAPDDIERGKEAGFDFHLTKPVDFHELRAVLGQIAA
jgi:CheY-like chemotaxis protein